MGKTGSSARVTIRPFLHLSAELPDTQGSLTMVSSPGKCRMSEKQGVQSMAVGQRGVGAWYGQ